MAENRLIGDYPVIGIRPTIDGRRGPLKVRESLEVQTMNMAKSAAKLISENLRYSNGEPVKVIIADTTIGRVAEAAACADKIKKDAQAKKESLIAEAEGQVARFNSLYQEYKKYPLVTKQRMFYETMEEVLPGMKIYISDGTTQSLLPLEPFSTTTQNIKEEEQ